METKTYTKRFTGPGKAIAQAFNLVTSHRFNLLLWKTSGADWQLEKQSVVAKQKTEERGETNFKNLQKGLDLGYRKLVNSYSVYRIILV